MNPWLIFAAVDGTAIALLAWWWIRAQERLDARYYAERAVRQAAVLAAVEPPLTPLDATELLAWRDLTIQLNDLEP